MEVGSLQRTIVGSNNFSPWFPCISNATRAKNYWSRLYPTFLQCLLGSSTDLWVQVLLSTIYFKLIRIMDRTRLMNTNELLRSVDNQFITIQFNLSKTLCNFFLSQKKFILNYNNNKNSSIYKLCSNLWSNHGIYLKNWKYFI